MTLLTDMKDIEDGVFEEGALHGTALGIVERIFQLPGEEYSDQECLRLIHQLVNAWSKLEDQGLS